MSRTIDSDDAETNSKFKYEIDMKLPCFSQMEKRYLLATILDRTNTKGEETYYVHFDGYNRRMDEWVTIDKFKPGVKPIFDGTRKREAQKKHHEEQHSNSHPESRTDDLEGGAKGENRAKRAKRSGTGSGMTYEPLPRNIDRIWLGRYEIDTWYYSPYPADVLGEEKRSEMLYICEYCLTPFRVKRSLDRHMTKCKMLCPPGDEIFRQGEISMFEVDGFKQRVYCQNLSLISKLFLDHKTGPEIADIFLFYVLTEVDKQGCHFVGYFSKEKESESNFNLACIMVLPPYQQKGYGRFLISFSYELSKKEGRAGTPLTPLSDLGVLSYFNYWKYTIIQVLSSMTGPISVKQISAITSITVDDIIQTIKRFQLLKYVHGDYVFDLSPAILEEHHRRRPKIILNSENLHWSPPVYLQTSKEKEHYKSSRISTI
ncbi:putative histone acetyltransferase MYST1 [Monocercomonoides exilis]|uniref:putative histone acetyltransferase MYST1 n=1 Tax=Monocercomonoides exilis TaxID=2049356 RepID=UPI00355A09E3|nr:putative histone acetyltransferase MYST1 [Monocercomonoides exilis]|eukprot:MONOS_12512.1-p1 / transcript=MONOS_12512.1 / gene=MONOS_12512 / organism=Monocercomonoides_exilis_PA203 / gene_product=Putative histone acetyltransferase MYST1 / transcript_product=Putative histone acetyltransferase MYST1 / location=Mono_scaffold00696:29309-31464(-) / protein_length=428 / sequence_SO=supercontig / SO=protein_coding / is_pseudo=false